MKTLAVITPLLQTWKNQLQQLPIKCLFLTPQELKHHPETEGLLFRSEIAIDEALLKHLPRLRFIFRLGSGIDHIDEALCQKKGIKIIATPGTNAQSVAEHALGMLLGLTKRIYKSYREILQNKWLRRENTGVELSQLTIAIIGFGNTGSAFARLLQPFHTTILAYDKYKKHYAPSYVIETDWERIFKEADVVSFHVPLTQETYHYFDKALLERFRKPIYLLNLSRGAVVDAGAVVYGLQQKKLLGVGLDVWHSEPPDSNDPHWRFLCGHPQVILTPHIAGWSTKAHENAFEQVLIAIKNSL